MNEEGINAIIQSSSVGRQFFFSSGWNPRHIEGIEHFFFYNLKYITNKKFIHGQPVCLGFILGCLLHEKLEDKFIDFFKSLDFNFTPESMNINWNDVDKTLSTLKEYVEKTGLWYGIANDFEYILKNFRYIKRCYYHLHLICRYFVIYFFSILDLAFI